MCLILKLDNEKVVSIANGQTESQSHRVAYYNIDIEWYIYKYIPEVYTYTYIHYIKIINIFLASYHSYMVVVVVYVDTHLKYTL